MHVSFPVVPTPEADISQSGLREARLAVVIPVYKHPGLMVEAIESALAQAAPFPLAVVIVNDGCPHPETDVIGEAYAIARPNVAYLRKPNGGLSSARNHGIAFVLRELPNVDSVYFLDADNRLTPTAMADAHALLMARPEIDWVYPNIDKFGVTWNGNYTPRYSRLLHVLFDNICEAGSLVSRRLLERGIRFDETMRAGFEDWDFWLQAIAKGCVGANLASFGFEYRQRAESMLRDSNRQREAILGYLQVKHAPLFRTGQLLQWEHEEAPRYALLEPGDPDGAALFTDPCAPHVRVDRSLLAQRFWASLMEPEAEGLPPFMVWARASFLPALNRLGLAQGMFWFMELLADHHHLVRLSFERSAGEIEVKITRGVPATADPAAAWMIGPPILSACLRDRSTAWIRSLDTPASGPDVVRVTLRAPFTKAEAAPLARPIATAMFVDIEAVQTSPFRQDEPVRWNWRTAYLPPQSEYYKLIRRWAGASAVAPRLPRGTAEQPARRVAFLLPVAAFSGVERVAHALADVLKQEGFEPHLFVLGAMRYEPLPDRADVFASLNFVPDGLPLWGGPHVFSGQEFRMQGDDPRLTETLLGLLDGFDLIVNCQVSPANAVLGELRRRGARVVGHFHVMDLSSLGRPVGHPYLALAFEHAYDLLLTCSDDMVQWLRAMGAPGSKLVHIANAPSYDLPANQVEASWPPAGSAGPARFPCSI
ncbi:MAG: glycosyltransferase [Acetobacteraceae bacterium]